MHNTDIAAPSPAVLKTGLAELPLPSGVVRNKEPPPLPPPPQLQQQNQFPQQHQQHQHLTTPFQASKHQQYQQPVQQVPPPIHRQPAVQQIPPQIQPRLQPASPPNFSPSQLTGKPINSINEHSTVKFDDLNLQTCIGGGGFGEVWRGTWRGTPVAVKVLTSAIQQHKLTDALLAEFQSEVEVLSSLRHPNICLFMGACFDPPKRAIVTELCRCSLWDALRNPLSPPYSPADGINWCWPVFGGCAGPSVNLHPMPMGTWPWILFHRVVTGACRGMQFLHSCSPPVLHRDLKSANLLLDDAQNVKICDFGLARLKNYTNSHTGNTGTVQWMAPEVLSSQKYNESADIYSFGVIMFELLTRKCPFENESQISCAMRVLNGERVSVPHWCCMSVPNLAKLIEQCLNTDPSSRPTFVEINDFMSVLSGGK